MTFRLSDPRLESEPRVVQVHHGVSSRPGPLSRLVSAVETADAEMKVPSAEKPELSNVLS